MSSPVCGKCGATNSPSATFCSNCGNHLTNVPPASAPAAPAYPVQSPSSAASYVNEAVAYERGKRVGRTKTGLLLLIIALVLGPVPFIGIIGVLLGLVGAILVILGRRAFGNTHARNTIWSVVIYVAGGVVAAAFAIGFGASLVSAALSNDPSILADEIAANFNILLIGAIVGSAITGIAYVLFTYALQEPMGRRLLWAAYGISLVIDITTFVIIGPQISAAVQQAVLSGTFNRGPIDTLQSQMQWLQALSIIPGVIYAIAYYLARSRVERGEIPQTPSAPPGPGMPTTPASL